MRRFGRMLAACLCAAAPSFADGQLKPEIQTGSMIPVQPKQLDPKDAGYVRKHFAQCVYRGAPAKALALLDHSDPVTVDMAAAGIRNVGKELDMEHCLGAQVGFDQNALSLKFPAAALRDLMAEEDYLARNRVAPTIAPDAPALGPTVISGGTARATAEGLVAFTDCTIRRDTVGADALLRTMPGSDKEHTAAAALAPALGQCLVAGQQVALSQANIRALIAYAMWNRFGRGAKSK